eukprot:8313160-Pyramimonas_sp.AAC.1
MMSTLQKVAIVLLQVLISGEARVPKVKPEMTLKVLSMSIVKDSLKEHRTNLFRFDYDGEGALRRIMFYVISFPLFFFWLSIHCNPGLQSEYLRD